MSEGAGLGARDVDTLGDGVRDIANMAVEDVDAKLKPPVENDLDNRAARARARLGLAALDSAKALLRTVVDCRSQSRR
jgi:hypothetical protein